MKSLLKSDIINIKYHYMESNPAFKTLNQRKGSETYNRNPKISSSIVMQNGQASLKYICVHTPCDSQTTSATYYMVNQIPLSKRPHILHQNRIYW